jgi:hypothetical protein
LGLHQLLPPDVRIEEEVRFGLAPIRGVPPRLMKMLVQLMGETALGLCDIAVVESGMPPGSPARTQPPIGLELIPGAGELSETD